MAAAPWLEAVDVITKAPGFFMPGGAKSISREPASSMPFQLRLYSSFAGEMLG